MTLNSTILRQIDTYLSEHKGQILNDWMNLVRIPSVRSERHDGAPFGEHCAEALRAAARLYEQNGFATVIRDEHGYAVSAFGTGEQSIGVFAHCDVVPPEGEWTVCPPFEPVIRDGYLYGRGCDDNKSAIVQTLYAAKIIRELGLPFHKRLVMVTGSNEESGMADMEAFAACEPMPDVSLVPDSSHYPYVSGEKGILRLTLTHQTPFESVLDFSGGSCFNAVLGEVTVRLRRTDALHAELAAAVGTDPRFELSTAGDVLVLRAKGITKHAAYPEGSVNAGNLAAQLLMDCPSLPTADRQVLADYARIAADAYGKALGISESDSFFGVLTSVNGIVSVCNGRLSMSLDVRYGSQKTGKEHVETVRRHTAAWECVCERISDGFRLDPDSKAAQTLRSVYRTLSGDSDATEAPSCGGTYARSLLRAYPISNTTGKTPAPELPSGHGGVHQPDECISIDDFLESLKILVCMILSL